FGEYRWLWSEYAVGMNVALWFIVAYAVVPWAIARRSDWRGMMPFFLGLAVPLYCQFNYVLWKEFNNSQDARFIYPALVCFVVWFGRMNAMFKSRGNIA